MKPMRLGGVLAVLAFAGCVVGEKGMSEDQFCAELARRECAQVVIKCTVVQPAACEAVRQAACLDFAARAKSATRVYRPENAEACHKKVDQVFAGGTITAVILEELNTACGRVFQGTADELAMCTGDFDCDKSLICDKGRCASRKLVAQGAACANPGEYCPRDQYCTKTGDLYLCAARKDRGSPCGPTALCREGLRCVGSCMDQLVSGSMCSGTSGVAEPVLWVGGHDGCVSGYCDPYMKVCAGGLGFAGDSSSCKAYGGLLSIDAGPGADASSADAAAAAAD